MKKIPPILPALAWLILTTILLSLPGSAFPQRNWFNRVWLDKWIHIALFSIMVFLWCRIASRGPANRMQVLVQITIYFFLYGVVMEFIQKFFIPNRSFDLVDIVADGIGCVLGLLVSVKVYIKK